LPCFARDCSPCFQFDDDRPSEVFDTNLKRKAGGVLDVTARLPGSPMSLMIQIHGNGLQHSHFREAVSVRMT
jgi:hypothetical protein